MKQYILIILAFSLTLPVAAQSRKKVGVVLSGGGAKGVAHIGALKVIEEAGIPIDYVVGTSMGSIVGGLYSIGYTPHQLDSMVKQQDWLFLLSDRVERRQKTFVEKVESEQYVLSLPFHKKPQEAIPDGIIRGQNLNNLFTTLTVGYQDSINFNQLPIPFACVSVDIREGKEVVFHRGRLSEAMRASMAIPGVFTPVRMDTLVLVDGGLLNNFPVDVAKAMGADIIIGVDVRSVPGKDDMVTGVGDIINKLTDMTGRAKYTENRKQVDVYIRVNVEGYTAASFNAEALDTLTVRGEDAARKQWKSLQALKPEIGIADTFVPTAHGPFKFLSNDTPIPLGTISFVGIDKESALKLIERSKLKENTEATTKQLDEAVTELYALQTYTNINYGLARVGDTYNVEFTLQKNSPNALQLGLRFDTEEVAAVKLNGAYQFKTRIPTKAVVTGRLGKRSSIRLDYLVLPNPLHFVNLSYMYQYNDINIYDHGDRAYNTTYSHHLGEVGYSHIFNQDLDMGIGLRYEYYDYSNFLYGGGDNSIEVKPEGYFGYYLFMRYETKDKKSFSTKGTSVQADLTLYTDNMVSYNGHTPFGAASLWWEKVFSPTRRFSLIPSFYGRVLFGQEVSYPYLNVMGGDTPGRYVPQQLPFVGIGFMEIFSNSLLDARLKLRERLGKSNYISLIANYALTDDDFGMILKGDQVFGVGIGYGYNTLFGPLDVLLSVSSRTKHLGFYASFGYTF